MNAAARLGRLILLLAAAAPAAGAQPYGLDSRPAFGAFLGGRMPASSPAFSGDWSAVVAFPNLTFLNPMGLVPMPGTSNLIVWEREGRIYHFPNDPDTSARTLVLDLSGQCQGWDDSGLMGVACHPGFATNRHLFVYYTHVTPGTVLGSAQARPPTATPNRDRLVRYTLDAEGVAVAGSETIFIDQVSQTVWHNGGGMFFHPENGFLHLTNGDDAHPPNNQRINHGLHGGVLRIDVDRRGGDISHPIPRQPLPAGSFTANYYIPNDNPFVGQPGVLEEFFALGLRSPHRMTLDPPTGRIFIGDVGAEAREELDVIEPHDPFGLNFQWNRLEGLQGDLTPPFIGVNRRPLLDYPHTEGAAIIGGHVYRGREFAADLGGRYIFGDNIANVIWMLDESVTPRRKIPLCTLPRGGGPNAGNDYVGLSSFGVDHDGELYLCQLSSIGGRIYRLRRGGPLLQPLPRLLSATGAFADTASLTPAPGLVPYTVNSPLWSDGADKARWMGIPDGARIGFATNGEWTFPEGSVWVKHFELAVNETNPAVRRRLETRLLVRDTNNHVYGATYKWRADHSDADLLDGPLIEQVQITGAAQAGELTSEDIGGPVAGSTARLADGWELTAGGADIWGAGDQFRFAYERRTGDFDVAVRVSSLTQTDLHTKAGLMVRDSLAPDARHIFAFVFPSNAARNNNDGGYEFQSRDTTGGSAAAIYPPTPHPRVNYPDTWLRLKRAGNTWTAYSGGDGRAWRLMATKLLALPDTVFFGLALTAHNGDGAQATAKFHFRGTWTQPWYYPGRTDCLNCHSAAAGGVLGVKTRQSNCDSFFPSTGVTDNQLRAWNHAGYFQPALDEATLPQLPRLAAITNEAFSLEHRVRSYLDANCSHCHRPGGPAGQAKWDARFETPLGAAQILGGAVADMLGVPGSRIVTPGDPGHSVMYQRMGTATAPHKMPPLAKNLVDQPAVDALAAWIGALTGLPEVTLVSPAGGSHFRVPAKIVLTARASTTNGTIARVEFYAGDTRLGEVTGPPYQLSWNATVAGTHEITALATDSHGVTAGPAPAAVTLLDPGADGLLAEYFDNLNLTGRKLARMDPVIDFDWGAGPPADQIGPDTFSVRWTGTVTPGFTETYTFLATVDDGFRLWVHNRLVINQWVDQAPTTHRGSIALQAGQAYPIRAEYYDNGSAATARLRWSSPSQPEETVPAAALRLPPPALLPPTLAIIAPAEGQAFHQPPFLDLVAEVNDANGDLARVEFLANGQKLGESTDTPFRWRWTAPQAGRHLLTVRAFDAAGAAASAEVQVAVDPLVIELLPVAAGAEVFRLRVAGAEGRTYRLEASEDLEHWSGAAVATVTGGAAVFIESFAQHHRFYRVVPVP